MKLLDKLKELGTEFVYVGSGSGFVYIGNANNAVESLRKVDETYRNNAADLIGASQKAIARNEKSLHDAKVKGDREEIERVEQSIEWHNKQINKQSEYIKQYVPFSEREVTEMYRRRFVAPLGEIIIVCGEEVGPYWTLDEVGTKRDSNEEG